MNFNFNSYDELYKYLPNKSIGEGSQGICYKKGKVVYKLFHDYYIPEKSMKEHLDFKNINVDSYYFYKGVIKINNKFSGVTMNYASGECIEKNILNQSFADLIFAAHKFEKDTKLISNLGIETYDLYFVNVLYDSINKSFNVVDCDEYCYSDKDTKKLYQENIQNLSNDIVRCLFDNRLLLYVTKSKILNSLLKIQMDPTSVFQKSVFLKEFISPSEILKILKNELSSFASKEVDNVKDCIKVLEMKVKK